MMAEEMNAVQITAHETGKYSKVELRRVRKPSYGPDQALIKVKGAAICGSDVHYANGDWPTRGKPPITMGHEFCGEIEALGENAKGFQVGDRVVCELPVGFCGTCKMCTSGYRNLCYNKLAPGIDIDGAYSQYVAMPVNLLHKLADSISYTAAAVMEPASIVSTGILRCPVKPGDFVVVFGAGTLGLSAVQMAKAMGAKKVVLVEYDNKVRGEMGRKLGADAVYYSSEMGRNVPTPAGTMAGDIVPIILGMSDDGHGADLVIECSGAEEALADAMFLLRRNGNIVYVGVPRGPITVDTRVLVSQSINMITSYASSPVGWKMVLDLVEMGKLDLESLVTNKYPLEDFDQAFDVLMNTRSAIKCVLMPNGDI